MPLLVNVLGACLVAASTASAADGPNGHAGEPWWSNPPAASPLAGTAKVAEPIAAAAPGLAQKSADGGPGRADAIADFAPLPPGSGSLETRPATYLQDAAAESRPVEKPKTLESPSHSSDKPLQPPRQLPANDAGASHVPPETAVAARPAAASSNLAPQSQGSPLALGAHNDKNGGGKTSPTSAMITVGGSLAIVLGIFFVIAWAMRKAAPRGSLMLPKEVFEILGRAPLGARQQVQMLRCGNKLLLVSITPNGTETLTEVTDPLEVDRIAGICQQAHPKSSTIAFRQVFQQLAPQTGEPDELDKLEPVGTRRKRYRWEDKHA